MVTRTIQLGKQGITDNFILGLNNQFTNIQNIKVSVLRSCCRNKDELKKISEELLEKLGENFTAKIVGYTINIKKWRKARE